MRTVYLRRFAGLTSLDSNLWRSHFSASGPPGVLASTVIGASPSSRQIHPDRNDGEAAADEHGERRAEHHQPPGVYGMIGAERLEGAGDAMTQVEADQDHADDVD